MGKAAEQQPGQSDKIFGILAKLSAGTGTAAQRALVGLRHFGTREAWQIVRGRVGDDNWTSARPSPACSSTTPTRTPAS
jgi:hypothetical protein